MPPVANVRELLALRGVCDRPNARRQMVNALAARGLDRRVLSAMAVIPRHAFADASLATRASVNCYLYTGDTVLTTPSVVATMIQALDLDHQTKVLEVGTGTGYQTALLALLSGCVFTIECLPSLVRQSSEALRALRLSNVKQRLGDGYQGWPEAAPFDAILVAAAPPTIPPMLFQQLHPRHGRMVIPIGPQRDWQRLTLVRRQGQQMRTADLGPTYFVPLTAGAGTPRPGDRFCRAAPTVCNGAC